MGPEHYWWGPWAGWWIFPFMMFVAMIIICFLFFWRRGLSHTMRDSDEHEDSETPLDILKKRYAKGEITKEEFEQIKKDIST